MGFAFFLLVNAVLFIRPAEIVPAPESLPIYNVLITTCLAVCRPERSHRREIETLREAHPCRPCRSSR